MIRKNLAIIISALLFASCSPAVNSPGAEGIGDPLYPKLGNGGYDARHYTLELSIDPQKNTLSGDCTLEAQATQLLSTFNLDFSGLTIEGVTVNQRKATYIRNERELTIEPAEPIGEGDPFTVTVTYGGSPERAPSFGTLWSSGWYHTGDEVFTSSEISGAATWFPVNDHPLDKASYSFRIAVPKPYVVAANGHLKQEQDNGDTVTYVWEAEEPMASYVVGVNIGEYVLETKQGPDHVLIRNYLPPNFPVESKAGIDQLADMLAFFSERFGSYPFAEYGIVIVDFPAGGPAAMETQTLSQHEQDELMFSLSEYVVAHELAHQWFGNSVSLETWQDIWLKEGAATYAGWLWLEQRENGTLDARVRHAYPMVAFSPNPPGNPLPTNLYTNVTFDRGAVTFHALRLQVGDEVFFQILQTYLKRFQYGNASTADFIAVAEEVSGQDLQEFFNGWLYAAQIPDIPEMGLD